MESKTCASDFSTSAREHFIDRGQMPWSPVSCEREYTCYPWYDFRLLNGYTTDFLQGTDRGGCMSSSHHPMFVEAGAKAVKSLEHGPQLHMQMFSTMLTPPDASFTVRQTPVRRYHVQLHRHSYLGRVGSKEGSDTRGGGARRFLGSAQATVQPTARLETSHVMPCHALHRLSKSL